MLQNMNIFFIWLVFIIYKEGKYYGTKSWENKIKICFSSLSWILIESFFLFFFKKIRMKIKTNLKFKVVFTWFLYSIHMQINKIFRPIFIQNFIIPIGSIKGMVSLIIGCLKSFVQTTNYSITKLPCAIKK